MDKHMPLKPRISEKSYALSESGNTYTFDVPSTATKHSVARAVAQQHNVSVEGVRLANVSGKTVRSFRRGGKSQSAKRSDVRKAYVTLKQGDKLPLFSAIEEEIKAEKKESK